MVFLCVPEGDGVWIRNKGEEEYQLISEYDFSNNYGALETITNFYGSSFSLFESNNYGTRIENYRSQEHFRYETGRNERSPLPPVLDWWPSECLVLKYVYVFQDKTIFQSTRRRRALAEGREVEGPTPPPAIPHFG